MGNRRPAWTPEMDRWVGATTQTPTDPTHEGWVALRVGTPKQVQHKRSKCRRNPCVWTGQWRGPCQLPGTSPHPEMPTSPESPATGQAGC